MEGERETLKKRCAHKSTKHLGTCKARQVEFETKLPLSLRAGGWLGVKDLNVVTFTSEPSNILIRPCNPWNDKRRGWMYSGSVVCWVYMMWEAGTGLYVTCQGSFELRSKFGLLLLMPVWQRHVRRGKMFRERLITATPRTSQNRMFNCISPLMAGKNKVTAFTGRARCVCEREYMWVCVLSNKELPFLRDYSTTAVSQNRENKLESQGEKSFMFDALITRKNKQVSHKLELVGW